MATTKAKETKVIQPKAKERVLPSSLETEEALLCCLMIDKKCADTVFNKLDAVDFYSNSHAKLFALMKELYAKNTPIDFVTISDKVIKSQSQESVGGISYLTRLTNAVPSAANFESYIELIKDASLKRKVIEAGNDISNLGFNEQEAEEALAKAEKAVFDLSKERDLSSLTPISDSLSGVITKLEATQRDPDSQKGVLTGFKTLDYITNGLQNGDLILIAARPSVGKTSLAMNIVTNSAVEGKKKVAVFSLEMPKEQLALRQICSISGVNMKSAQNGSINRKEWDAIFAARKKLQDSQIFVDDSSLSTPLEILSKCRRLKREKGLDLVMIDYLQLMSSGKKRDENKTQEIGEISKNLKIMARELNVPVIVLSQLSRAIESRKENRPQLSDLRDSGAIEQDADIVMFIHRPEKYAALREAGGEQIKGDAYLIISKHRNGETCEEGIPLRWIGETTSFVDPDTKFAPKSKKVASEDKTSGVAVDTSGVYDYDDSDVPPEA
ncbi:MAG: replicative DNA helicase [Firmicutes bacterium]|nr:replicative DNA helicase [Bacillota bacterium]